MADIDRWEKGMAGEFAAVQSVAAKIKDAKTGEDTLNTLMGPQDMATVEAGARPRAWTRSATT